MNTAKVAEVYAFIEETEKHISFAEVPNRIYIEMAAQLGITTSELTMIYSGWMAQWSPERFMEIWDGTAA